MADVVFGQVHIIPWERIEEEVVFLVFLEFNFTEEGDTNSVFIENGFKGARDL